MRPVRPLRLFAALPLAVVLAACGSDPATVTTGAGATSSATTPSPIPTAVASSAAAPTTSAASPGVASGGNDMIGGSVSSDLSSKPQITVPSEPAPNQLQTKTIVEGNGQVATAGDTVKVQYVGVLYDSGKQFDSSWDRGGQPVSFPLNRVIPGFAEGITGMKVGGRREIVIPPDLGYGAQGAPPDIPANATLVFVVDLVGVS